MESVKCLKCGLVWTPAVQEPKACPKCKSYSWREPRKRKPY